jgi:hypothetical protein
LAPRFNLRRMDRPLFKPLLMKPRRICVNIDSVTLVSD